MTKLVQPSFLFFEVMTEQPQVRIGKLMPNWMINLTDRIMQYYIDRYLNCDPVVLDRPPEPQPGHQYLLYAHIPFCKTLCSYCTFHRFLFKEHKAREYFVNLRKEMDYVKALGYDFTSMYIGGGTTTILEDELIRTIEHARTLFPGIKEVSCETDPLQIATPTFRNLKGLVDRMSIGVQSFNDDILKMTERYDQCRHDLRLPRSGSRNVAARHGSACGTQSAPDHDVSADGHKPDSKERQADNRRQGY